MSRDLVRACAIGRAATLRRGPGPAGVRADGLFSPAGWDTPTWAQATCGGRVPTCRANACGGRPAATSVSRPASAHGLRKSGHGASDIPGLYGRPPTILILAGAPQGHPGLNGPLRDTSAGRGGGGLPLPVARSGIPGGGPVHLRVVSVSQAAETAVSAGVTSHSAEGNSLPTDREA